MSAGHAILGKYMGCCGSSKLRVAISIALTLLLGSITVQYRLVSELGGIFCNIYVLFSPISLLECHSYCWIFYFLFVCPTTASIDARSRSAAQDRVRKVHESAHLMCWTHPSVCKFYPFERLDKPTQKNPFGGGRHRRATPTHQENWWLDPGVYEYNKLEAHTSNLVAESESVALSMAADPATVASVSERYLSLDGTWDFVWVFACTKSGNNEIKTQVNCLQRYDQPLDKCTSICCFSWWWNTFV